MELVKVFDKMLNPITMWKSDVIRQDQLKQAKLTTNRKLKKERNFISSVHKKEPLK